MQPAAPWRSRCLVRAARTARAGALLLAVGVVTAGCGTFSDSFRPIERQLVAQQPEQALALLEKQSHPGRDEVLYLMNKGMLLRMAGQPVASNEALEAAKKRIAELYATSVSEQATSLLVNDATRSFTGAEFEQVLVNVYMALNYLDQHKLDDARVEALQVDIRLRELAGKIPDSVYREDAFARYLTGIIFEELGEWSDAMISYRQAYKAYGSYQKNFGSPVPESLKVDLLRLAQKMGLDDELRRYKQEFGISEWKSVAALRDQGELILTFHNGLAPPMLEKSVANVNPATGRFVRISLPYYEGRQQPVRRARVIVNDAQVYTQPAEDISAIAMRSLDAKMPAITARAIARAIAKDQTARRAGKDNELAGLIINIANTLTERADTRSWATLPANIQLARIPLPPGSYSVKVELLGNSDEVLATRDFNNVAISAKAKQYLSFHWIPAYPETPQRRR